MSAASHSKLHLRIHHQGHSLLYDWWPTELLQFSSALNIRSQHSKNYSKCRTLWLVHTWHNIKHVLASMHWLPVEFRVQYNLTVTPFPSANNARTDLHVWTDRLHTPSRHLWSRGCNYLQQDWVKHAFVERAVCNSLPQSTTSNISRIIYFKLLLKTKYFNYAHRQWRSFCPHLWRFFTLNCE